MKDHYDCDDTNIHEITQYACKQFHLQCFHHKIKDTYDSESYKNVCSYSTPDEVIKLINDQSDQHNIQDIKEIKFQETEVEILHWMQVKKIYQLVNKGSYNPLLEVREQKFDIPNYYSFIEWDVFGKIKEDITLTASIPSIINSDIDVLNPIRSA